jgi:hypothetical protein
MQTLCDGYWTSELVIVINNVKSEQEVGLI